MVRFQILLIPLYLICISELRGEELKLPTGFTIETVVEDITGVRAFCFNSQGDIYASTKAGKVWYIPRDGKPEILITGLKKPYGIDYYEGDLYVSETSQILRYSDIDNRKPLHSTILNKNFPDYSYHGGKYLKIGPDKKIYFNMGAPCNSCLQESPVTAAILRMNLDGSNLGTYVTGVRNSVGFDWNPIDGSFWFSDNGRDNMGDNLPPDELNRSEKGGEHFGFPWFHGNTPDPVFVTPPPGFSYTPPSAELPAHVAPLGIAFIPEGTFPPPWNRGILIAEHGSFNRSEKIGYRISYVPVHGSKTGKYTVFIEGWLRGEEHFGRPVDLRFSPGGELYISDDYAHKIYKVYYNKEN